MNQGILYEGKIFETIRVAQTLAANVELVCANTAAFSNGKPDLTLNISGNTVHVEIKKDSKAQLGGTSVKYVVNDDGSYFVFCDKGKETVEQDIQELVIGAIREKEEHIVNLITHWKDIAPKEFSLNIQGVPSTITRDMWKHSVEAGKILLINTKVTLNEKFIHDHYRHKDCFYMQIGDSGLFYLERNPLNLPIPQLKGDINLELRVTRGGSSLNKKFGVRTVSSAIRVQGRMQFRGSSPYTLENLDHVLALFG